MHPDKQALSSTWVTSHLQPLIRILDLKENIEVNLNSLVSACQESSISSAQTHARRPYHRIPIIQKRQQRISPCCIPVRLRDIEPPLSPVLGFTFIRICKFDETNDLCLFERVHQIVSS